MYIYNMKEETKNMTKAQGAEIVKEVDKKTQQTSKSYLVRKFGEHLVKLRETELITEEELKEAQEIQKKAVMRFMGLTMEL